MKRSSKSKYVQILWEPKYVRKSLGEYMMQSTWRGITIRQAHSKYYSNVGRTIFQKVQTVKKIHLKIEDNPFHPFATLHTRATQWKKDQWVGGHLELLLGDAVVGVSSELLAADVLDCLELWTEEETCCSQQLEGGLWYPEEGERFRNFEAS